MTEKTEGNSSTRFRENERILNKVSVTCLPYLRNLDPRDTNSALIQKRTVFLSLYFLKAVSDHCIKQS